MPSRAHSGTPLTSVTAWGSSSVPWSNPAKIDSYSIRLDHAVSEKLKLFFRFSDAPSSAATRGSGFCGNAFNELPERLRHSDLHIGSNKRPLQSDRKRFPIELQLKQQTWHLKPFKVSAGRRRSTWRDLQDINAMTNPGYSVDFGLDLGRRRCCLTQGDQSGEQRQWNVVDTVSLSIGTHQLKFGIDYRRLFSYPESLESIRYLR